MGEICWLVGTTFDSFAAALWIGSQFTLSSPKRSKVVRSVVYTDRSNLIPYPSGTHRASFVPIKIGSTFASFHVSINRCLMFESTSRDQIPTRYFSIFHVPLNLACFIPSPCELHWKWRIDFSPFWKVYIQGKCTLLILTINIFFLLRLLTQALTTVWSPRTEMLVQDRNTEQSGDSIIIIDYCNGESDRMDASLTGNKILQICFPDTEELSTATTRLSRPGWCWFERGGNMEQETTACGTSFKVGTCFFIILGRCRVTN